MSNKFTRTTSGFLTSTRPAIALILYLAATSLFATLVPQGRDSEFYAERFGVIGDFALAVGFDEFFLSPAFLIPSALFFLNLSSCTVARLARRFRARARPRFGPDLVHVGILLLMIGGLVSLLCRQEGFSTFSPGDVVELPTGRVMRVLDTYALTYDGGRPKDWITRVEISGGDEYSRTAAIEVNRPLRDGPFMIYQYSFSMGENGPVTGLLLVRDPGFPLVLVSLFLVGTGLLLTFIQKIRDGV